MSFHLSHGTLDTMAGIFAPSRRPPAAGGGGDGGGREHGGTLLGFAVASMFPKHVSPTGSQRAINKTKQAFGGGSHTVLSRRAISTLDRTARRVPEVMVRITGRQHGAGHVLANFAYISRLGHGADKELALYTSEGEVIRDGRAMQDLAQDWQEWEVGDDARRKGATSLSMILSMPSGTDPERLKAAALDFAREEFANRSWVASLHIDRDHPHVHLTFARRDHDGRRFHPTRDDLFRYRQRFAEKLRARGIEANATPAKARGVDPAHEPIVIGKLRAKGQTPRLDRARSTRAERVAVTGKPDPVYATLAARQVSIRHAYERSIAELRTSPSIVHRTVASSLQRFLDDATVPEPNAIRAVIMQAPGRGGGPRLPARVVGEMGAVEDPIAAALMRSRAMRDRIAERRATEQTRPDAAKTQESRSSSAPDQPVPSPARPSIGSGLAAGEPDPIDKVMRQVQERERIRRSHDRDRDPDRKGLER